MSVVSPRYFDRGDYFDLVCLDGDIFVDCSFGYYGVNYGLDAVVPGHRFDC